MRNFKKYRVKALAFSLFLIGYFSINYINLNDTRNLHRSIDSLQNPIEAKRDQEIKDELDKSRGKLLDGRITKIVVKGEGNNPGISDRKNVFNMLIRGESRAEEIDCGNSVRIRQLGSNDENENVDFEVFLENLPTKSEKVDHYYLVYAMESEPHSSGGNSWINADFRMWYNLDRSFPAPATYFDMNGHLPDLIQPPKVRFEDKEQSAPIVWVLSNCGAFNGREKYVEKLMKLIPVHSYGNCLNNKEGYFQSRMQGNIELYSKYKFVIAIENSNCEDYVTEKLVHAIASTSIPIVAGRDNKPDYLKFMPNGSYINIYDYKTVKDLADHIHMLSTNKAEYEKYISFRFKHNHTRASFRHKPLTEVIKIAKTVINPNERFFSEIVAKEASLSKICKIAKYLYDTPTKTVQRDIKLRRQNRPTTSEACLKPGNLNLDFD